MGLTEQVPGRADPTKRWRLDCKLRGVRAPGTGLSGHDSGREGVELESVGTENTFCPCTVCVWPSQVGSHFPPRHRAQAGSWLCLLRGFPHGAPLIVLCLCSSRSLTSLLVCRFSAEIYYFSKHSEWNNFLQPQGIQQHTRDGVSFWAKVVSGPWEGTRTSKTHVTTTWAFHRHTRSLSIFVPFFKRYEGSQASWPHSVCPPC